VNPIRDTWVNPKIEIRPSPGKGKGMFAKEKVRAGEKILVWGGDYTDTKGAEAAKAKGQHVMQWDDNLWSVEWRGDDPGFFVNHSCDANAWMTDTFTVVAKRDIPVGEEVTADYALWEADESYVAKWDCSCGAPDCRKKVTGKDWQLPQVQERYAAHFAPLVARRIAKL